MLAIPVCAIAQGKSQSADEKTGPRRSLQVVDQARRTTGIVLTVGIKIRPVVDL
jgi:hypothetical protein